MFHFYQVQVLFLFIIFHGYDCQRRIKGGAVVKAKDKNYVVYLLKAALSPQNYNGWLCGGAIVSEYYIVTSAACVTDVQHLYAIAGYNTYVQDTKMYADKCTNKIKKKIIFICTPTKYELDYQNQAKWSNMDIALVKVESPYNFVEKAPTECSYTPGKIEVNYDEKYQKAGVDAIVLGWGHTTKYREKGSLVDGNEKELHYASTLIQEKEICKTAYKVYPEMSHVIDTYMICADEEGTLDDTGKTLPEYKPYPLVQGCVANDGKLPLQGELSFENADIPDDEIVLIENSRKDTKLAHFSRNDSDYKSHNSSQINKINNTVLNSRRSRTTKNEICQVENADDSEDQIRLKKKSRKDIKLINYSRNNSDQKSLNASLINKMNKTVINLRRNNKKSNGICQNDHGGPLVTWVGAHEMLIGVASAFKLNEKKECIGPYLYTSTQCNGLFLDCILENDKSKDPSRREICGNLLEQGLKLVEKHISWKDHPDGPAENEKNGTTPAPLVGTHISWKNHPDGYRPAENEKNQTTPAPLVETHISSKDHPDELAENEKNGTTPAPLVETYISSKDHPDGPAENKKNRTTPASIVEPHISWKDHPDGPAENEKNGTTPARLVETHISWKDHPDGPAENEKNGTTPAL